MRRQRCTEHAVDQHPAQPSAEDDAEGGPNHQIADLILGGGRLAVEGRIGPQLVRPQQPQHMPPAQQQPGDIGQGVPADRDRPKIASAPDRYGERQDGFDHGR